MFSGHIYICTFRHKKIHSAELNHAWIGEKDCVKKEQNNDTEDYEELLKAKGKIREVLGEGDYT